MATQVKSLNTTKLDSKLDIDGLTDVSLSGSGVLDKFLQLQRLVLDREFNDGRIHGKEYADSFIATYTINMELAIKFLLEKEKQFYEIELIEANINNSKKDLELKEYELTKIKPQELALKTAQVNAMLKDIELKDYELKFIMPQELAIKTSQLAIAQKELLLKAKQLELAEYELLHKLPAEVAGILANNELTNQKKITEKAQTDSSVIGPGSVIDWNVKVLDAQVKGIDQEAKQKIMRMLIDTWTTRVNNDSAEAEPAGLGDSVIKSAVATAKASAGIP